MTYLAEESKKNLNVRDDTLVRPAMGLVPPLASTVAECAPGAMEYLAQPVCGPAAAAHEAATSTTASTAAALVVADRIERVVMEIPRGCVAP